MARAVGKNARLIGGVFGLPVLPFSKGAHERAARADFLAPSAHQLVNARSAFWALATALRPGCVWLPSYLCSTVVDGFQTAGCKIKFFPVSANLTCPDDGWLAAVAPGDFVLRIHYFGFGNEGPVFAGARARGACLIDDAAQALLTPGLGVGANFIVFSPRKFLGVPDGACLLALDGSKPDLPPLEAAPVAWWLEMFTATLLRRDFDLDAPESNWFERFQAAEAAAPTGPYAMSELSRRLLDFGFDFSAITGSRRRNYQFLAERLGEMALFPKLPAGVVPLGFPVVIDDRDRVRRHLFQQQIFPPVHWPVQGLVPEEFQESHWLSQHVMTLPCDQRYTLEDMERMAGVLLQAEPQPWAATLRGSETTP